jgi:hypothetical protein
MTQIAINSFRSHTRQTCHLRLLPQPQATAASFLERVPEKTVRTVYAAFLQQVDGENKRLSESKERECDAALNEFLAAFFRVAERANVWQLAALWHLAPVIFTLDAQLEASKTGIELDRIEMFDVINAAAARVVEAGKLFKEKA